jgi:hypothetical protein
MSLKGQRVISTDDAGAVALSDAISHLYGIKNVVLTKPSKAQFLVLEAEAGTWRLGLGDRSASGTNDMPAAAVVGADSATGAKRIVAGQQVVIPAPTSVTVRSYGATDALTYSWV